MGDKEQIADATKVAQRGDRILYLDRNGAFFEARDRDRQLDPMTLASTMGDLWEWTPLDQEAWRRFLSLNSTSPEEIEQQMADASRPDRVSTTTEYHFEWKSKIADENSR